MKIKILVIEDEEAINDVISISLKAAGYDMVMMPVLHWKTVMIMDAR